MKSLILPLLVVLLALAGCGGSEPAPAAETPDTTAGLATGTPCETCIGSDSVGAVCDETLPLGGSMSVAVADSATPEPEPVPEPKSEPEPEPPPKPRALPRMWDYGSEKCIPCQTMKGILDPMAAEYQGKVDIRIVNVYEEQALAQQARIQVIPTQIFYDPDGSELFRHVGVYPRDSIVARFKEYGWE